MNKSAISRILRKEGVDESIISRALSNKPKALRIPRATTKKLGETLQGGGRAVVTWRKGKFKVYSYEGHQSQTKASSENAKKHKPWEHTERVKNGKKTPTA